MEEYWLGYRLDGNGFGIEEGGFSDGDGFYDGDGFHIFEDPDIYEVLEDEDLDGWLF